MPEEERSDPALREELKRLSRTGLKAITWICLVGPGFMLGLTTVLRLLGFQSRLWIVTDLAIMGTGLLIVPFWVIPGLSRYQRVAGCVAGYGIVVIFILTAVIARGRFPGAEHAVSFNISLVMLVAIAALPLRPMQTLAVGSSIMGTHLVAVALFPESLFVPEITPL